jgi:PKD repeat protein
MFKSIKKLFAVLVIATGAWAQLQPPVITTWMLPNGEVGAVYRALIEASGYDITYSLESGSLPPGLEFCDYYDYGEICGIPTQTGTFTFTVKAENFAGNDTKELAIVIRELQKLVITTETLPNGEVGGANYMAIISVNTGDSYNITWSLESGSLPPGLGLVDGGRYSNISGTPTQAGTYTFTLKAENGAGSDTKSFTIVITELQPPIITETSLKSEVIGSWVEIIATGFNITWSFTSGQLPDGCLLLNVGGYVFVYCPNGFTSTGTYTFTLKLENAAGSDTKPITLVIEELKKPSIITTLPNGIIAEEYREQIATGFNIEWSFISGNWPPGFELNGNNIYGYPTEAGTYTFTLKAENGAGNDTKEITLVINADNLPVIPPKIARGGSLITQTRNGLNLTASSNATVEIYGLNGNLVSRQSFASGVYAISLGHLPKGIYIVKATFGNEKQVLRMPIR